MLTIRIQDTFFIVKYYFVDTSNNGAQFFRGGTNIELDFFANCVNITK
jgi:hypothetical protein